MIVMIVGSTGFIGGRLVRAFAAAGHEVVCASRHGAQPQPGCARHAGMDYTAMPDPVRLVSELAGVEVLINAVGILRADKTRSFAALHSSGPSRIFAACAQAGVRRVIQISALGAEAGAIAGYHRSKHAADAFLSRLPLDWAIVQPSLVYGAGGTSAQLFDRLASLPWLVLPDGGRQLVQPVHIDDLVEAVRKLAESPTSLGCVMPVVGPVPVSLREFIQQLRNALGLRAARTISIPRWIVRAAAGIGDRLPGSLLDSETLGMLERGNTGDPQPLTHLLGRAPRPVADFVAPELARASAVSASLTWLAPLLRVSVAAMWLIAAIVSAGLYPRTESLALLRTVGVPGDFAPAMLYAAIGIDFALGILTLLPRRPRGLWTAQIALVGAYTVFLTWRLPELWLEPFGPLAKNLPILALLLLLRRLEPRR